MVRHVTIAGGGQPTKGSAEGPRSALESSHAARLEGLVPGVSVAGVVTDVPVDVVATQWHGANFITLTYRDSHGAIAQAVLGRDHQAGLRLTRAGRTRAFHGDADSWRLAAEALRIRYPAAAAGERAP